MHAEQLTHASLQPASTTLKKPFSQEQREKRGVIHQQQQFECDPTSQRQGEEIHFQFRFSQTRSPVQLHNPPVLS